MHVPLAFPSFSGHTGVSGDQEGAVAEGSGYQQGRGCPARLTSTLGGRVLARAWWPWPLPVFHLRRFSMCVNFQGELSKENEVLLVMGERIEEGVGVAAPDPHYVSHC